MLFRFHFGRSRDGGWRVASVPLYHMPYWNAVHVSDDCLVYRPSQESLVFLLKTSLIAAFLLALMIWFWGLPGRLIPPPERGPNPQLMGLDDEQLRELERSVEKMKETLPADVIRELDEKHARQRRELANERAVNESRRRALAVAGRVFHWFAFIALAVVAVGPILSHPFNQVALARTHGGELVIRKRGLWTSHRRWPLNEFGQIVYRPEEEFARNRAIRMSLGWRWMVELRSAPEISDKGPPSIVDSPGIVFYVDHQKDRPHDTQRATRRVRSFVKQLRRFTGVDQVVHTEVEDVRSWFGLKGRRYRSTSVSKPIVQRSVYHSLDEVPDHLREDLEQAIQSRDGDGPLVHRSVRVTIRDESGNEQTYTSLDEMPDDVRRRYEQLMRQSGKRPRDSS